MKKFLPALTGSTKLTTSTLSVNKRGFTLIEILVVISIVAILAVIGVSVYSGAQVNARDGKRRAEIATLAKSIESARDPVAGTYSYTDADYNSDFKTNKPEDPSQSTRKYCIMTNQTTNTSPTATATIQATGNPGCATFTCPAVVVGAVANTCATVEIDKTNALSTDITATTAAKGWVICTVLEKGGTFCQSNAQ